MCKLMIANRINEPKLLSRLLILFYNPTTAEDVRLRQCLSVFFQAFAFSSPHHRICIEACFLPTLRVCVHAPKTSPLKEIALSDLAEYMLNLTNTAALPESCASQSGAAAEMAAGIHERLGVVLLNEVLSEPESIEARAFCKALNSLNLAPPNAEAKVDVESLSTLSVLAVSASEAVDNRFAKTALTKFQKDLNELTGLQGAPLPHYGHVISAVLRALCVQTGGAELTAEQQAAVLERTKSHLERRKEEINAALYNAGEGGKKRRGKLFSFENQLEDEDSDDDDSEGEEEDEEEDDEEQEQEQEQEQEEDSEEEEEEEEEEEAPRSRRNRRG